jgi:hypothetical protein
MHNWELTKFLLARNFDGTKVCEMLNNHLKWVGEFKSDPDEVFPDTMAEGYPIGTGEGHDREGNLIHFARVGNGGKVSPIEFAGKHGVDRCIRWNVRECEMMCQELRDQKFYAKRFTFIYDIKGLGGFDSDVYSYGKLSAKILSDQYPEMVTRAILINTPAFFRGVFWVLSKFIDERTSKKISMLGGDYKDEIAKFIDPKFLPAFCGGSNESWMSKGGRSWPTAEEVAARKAAQAAQVAAATAVLASAGESPVPAAAVSPSAAAGVVVSSAPAADLAPTPTSASPTSAVLA